MELFRAPICVLDTETSGLPRQSWASVVELAAVIISPEGEELAHFETFVRPFRLPPDADKALAVSGITREQLATAPEAHTVHRQWTHWMEERGNPWVTSYNVSFDKVMTEERLGLRKMRWASCIMLRAMAIMGPAGVLRNANPNHPSYNDKCPWLFPSLTDKVVDGRELVGAATFFGVKPDHDQTHRALDDARIAAKVACAIRRLELEREAA